MFLVQDLSMRFGSKILFKNVSFQLKNGGHYGLVGANGSGKSTLMKILSGEISQDKGSFSLSPFLTLGNLKQNHFIYENEKILDVVMMGKEKLWSALSKKATLLNTPDFNDEILKQLEKEEQVIQNLSGYRAPSIAAKLLEGLGIATELHEKNLSLLSGGYKLRVLLAQVLFSEPDLLLLDEPTNHLDIYSIEWLQNYLTSFPGIILLSSHDKAFLNAVTDHILDLDHETIKLYKGNFDAFLETKATDLAQKVSQIETQEKKKEDLEVFITRFKAKATKAAQAQSKMRLVEKLEEEMALLETAPTSRLYPKIKFEQIKPSGALPLVVKELHKHYGEKKVLENISFEVERGLRLAILGENGIGKSTLLEILSGRLEPTQGSFSFGHGAQISYFPQDPKKEIEGDENLLDWLHAFDTQKKEQDIREILGKVLFSGDQVEKKTASLSGGELARLMIAKMMLLKANLLIFDEPTNHLDMESTDALLEALQSFPGTLIFVSHNRYFISKIATHILEIRKKEIKLFNCSYEEYLEKRDFDLLSTKTIKDEGKNLSRAKKEGQSAKFEEQKELRNLKNQLEKKITASEKKCHQLEEKLKEIHTLLASPNFYEKTTKEEIEKILKEQLLAEEELEKTMVLWETLSEEFFKI